ncbi:DUF6265 family protein [Terrimonas sp. NA20]|uniref:DUF6265 family protein n=1 Tax=Terrimonas ginsenosidimutans TaxID=2908004 RepID=A0ABS9KVI1_9BACT|nr:DUF6265 family protein [Terrimonas ginsenosidimutans]MCG2616320.1 DUF6265 family protein [Terrimonas ginsenosidimutans]
MKKEMKLFIVIVSLVFIYAWTTKPARDIKKTEWLIGTWENKTPKGTIYETWRKVSADEFSGKSYILKDRDTIVFETIRLVQETDGLFYVPTVKNQNDAFPVRFAATTISATKMVFENPQHDFPKTISYTQIATDSLVAEIGGSRNGQERRQAFPMKRIR